MLVFVCFFVCVFCMHVRHIQKMHTIYRAHSTYIYFWSIDVSMYRYTHTVALSLLHINTYTHTHTYADIHTEYQYVCTHMYKNIISSQQSVFTSFSLCIHPSIYPFIHQWTLSLSHTHTHTPRTRTHSLVALYSLTQASGPTGEQRSRCSQVVCVNLYM